MTHNSLLKHPFNHTLPSILLMLTTFSLGTKAGWSEDLKEDAANVRRWQEHVQHLTDIESKIDVPYYIGGDIIPKLQARFADPSHLHNLNLYIHKKSNPLNDQDFFQETGTENMMIKEYESIIDALPNAKQTSYKGVYLNTAYWEEVGIGDLFIDRGFMHTQGSILPIFNRLKSNMLMKNLYHPVILKVESNKARLFNFAYQRNIGDMLMPRSSHFKIIDKFYHPEHDVYFLHLRDSSGKVSTDIKKNRGFVDFQGVRHRDNIRCY